MRARRLQGGFVWRTPVGGGEQAGYKLKHSKEEVERRGREDQRWNVNGTNCGRVDVRIKRFRIF